ncbi:reverse transcriptase domain-containing protein [Tanacetum coccineum]
MSGCSINQKVKYTVGSFVGKALTWWNSQIHTLSREVAVSMSWNDFKFMMIEEFCPSYEMQKLETKLWNHAMVGAGHAAYTDRFHELARLVPHLVTPESRKIERDNNKMTRIGNDFASIANPVGRENIGAWTKCTTCNSYHAPGGPCRTCFNYNRPSHLEKDYRGMLRNVNPVNARNATVRGRGNQGNQARDRAFMLGAEEARQDPNIMTGIEPNELGFKYKIEIASGQLVEIDKVIKGCKLEIEVVRIPLPDGKVLRVLGEKPEEKMRQLKSAKAKEKEQEEIVVVRDFPEVFLDDLSGLPPVQEIEF